MRSLAWNVLYTSDCPPTDALANQLWVCINCWELLMGHDTKMEHVNARHLLTASLAASEGTSWDSFIKLCRVYGRINPEETHVVLFYIPEYVREAVRTGRPSPAHIVENRARREAQSVSELGSIFSTLLKHREKKRQTKYLAKTMAPD